MLVLAGVVPAAAHAQVLYGSVVGNVEDSSGAALPGATVTLTNKGTGLVQTAVTGETGTFTFTNVQAGTYDVKVSMQGFKEAVRDRRAGHGQHREPRGLAAGTWRPDRDGHGRRPRRRCCRPTRPTRTPS